MIERADIRDEGFGWLVVFGGHIYGARTRKDAKALLARLHEEASR